MYAKCAYKYKSKRSTNTVDAVDLSDAHQQPQQSQNNDATELTVSAEAQNQAWHQTPAYESHQNQPNFDSQYWSLQRDAMLNPPMLQMPVAAQSYYMPSLELPLAAHTAASSNNTRTNASVDMETQAHNATQPHSEMPFHEAQREIEALTESDEFTGSIIEI